MPYIEQDKSVGKKDSHARLHSFLSEFKEQGLVNVYNKEELTRICNAYNVPFRVNWVKKKMAVELAKSIWSNSSSPSYQILNNYCVLQNSNSGSSDEHSNSVPVLRLRQI